MSFPYPLSLQDFRKIYSNIKILESEIDIIDKLKLYSIKKNYGDYTFYCKNIKIYKTDLILQHSLLTVVRDFFQKFEKNIYDKLNKQLFIYHEDPYNITYENLNNIATIEINGKYSFDTKDIIFTGIRFLVIDCFERIQFWPSFDPLNLSISNILNKNYETELDSIIEKLLKVANYIKTNSSPSYYKVEKILNFVNFFHMYQDIEKHEEKITKYLKSRKLL